MDRRDRNVRGDLAYEEFRKKQAQLDPGSFPGGAQALRNPNTGPVLRGAPYPFSFSGTESRQIAPMRANRRYLLIQNKSATNLYVAFGADANALTGITISPGGNYEPYQVLSDSIFVIGAADGNALLVEGLLV